MASLVFTVDIEGEFEEFSRDVADMGDEFLINLGKSTHRIENDTHKLVEQYLGAYPPAWHSKQSKFKWSNNPEKNARARRWWFANLPESSTGFYNRTGAMGEGWRTDVSLERNGDNSALIFSIANPNKGATYVYGYAPEGYARVPSHEVTGWVSSDPQKEAMQRIIERGFQSVIQVVDDVAEGLGV